jgi:Flp pilus assembly protein TadB
MSLEEITLALFAACNSERWLTSLRSLKAATDTNGASSISCTTWALILIAHISTVAYALVNRTDWVLAACFATNAMCCVAILAIAYWKRQRHAKRLCRTARPALCVAA